MPETCYTCKSLDPLLSIGDLIMVETSRVNPWNKRRGLIEKFHMSEFGPQMKFMGVTDYLDKCAVIKLCPVCGEEIKTFNFFKISVQGEFI